MKASSVLQGLIDALKVLPGVGNRSAQRMAFHLLQHDQKGALRLSQSIQKALEEIRHCQQCNTLTETDVCETCADPRRDRSLLCIVESAADQAMIEASHSYQGLYFVLLGKISPLDGLGPNEIFFDKLMARVHEPELKEVVLATNFTTEGETTAHYLAKSLTVLPLKVTRISRGVPIGSELEYVDASTIGWALMDRRDAEC